MGYDNSAWSRECTGPGCPACTDICRWCGKEDPDHTEDGCTVNPYRRAPAGSGGARLTVETRKAYTITLGGKPRRYWSKGAAYYALAKRLVGSKYMPALSTAIDNLNGGARTEAEASELTGLTVEAIRTRADRALEMFTVSFGGWSGHEDPETAFDSDKWQKYIRRVARKLRLLDEHAARSRSS